MKPARLRAPEWAALTWSVALLAVSFDDWYAQAGAGRTMWEAFAVLDVLIALIAAGGLALAYTTASRSSPAVPLAIAVLTTTLGALVFLLLLYRLADQPGPDEAVEVLAGAWLGLAATGLVVVATFWSLRVEAPAGDLARRRVAVEHRPAPAAGEPVQAGGGLGGSEEPAD